MNFLLPRIRSRSMMMTYQSIWWSREQQQPPPTMIIAVVRYMNSTTTGGKRQNWKKQQQNINQSTKLTDARISAKPPNEKVPSYYQSNNTENNHTEKYPMPDKEKENEFIIRLPLIYSS